MARPTQNKTTEMRVPEHAVVRHIVDGAELGVSGPICARTSSDVRERLGEAIGRGEGDLVVHLGEAEVWDATGLGVLVGAHRRAQARGRRLVVVDASPRLCRLMCATKLDRLMNVQGDLRRYVPLARTA